MYLFISNSHFTTPVPQPYFYVTLEVSLNHIVALNASLQKFPKIQSKLNHTPIFCVPLASVRTPVVAPHQGFLDRRAMPASKFYEKYSVPSNARSTGNKYKALKNQFSGSNICVILITETGLPEDISLNQITNTGCIPFGTNRTDCFGGFCLACFKRTTPQALPFNLNLTTRMMRFGLLSAFRKHYGILLHLPPTWLKS